MPCLLNLLVAAQPSAIKGEEAFAVAAVHEGTAAFCGKASLHRPDPVSPLAGTRQCTAWQAHVDDANVMRYPAPQSMAAVFRSL